MSLRSPTGRLARWTLYLQPFDMEFTYAPARTNIIADMLSRPPMDENDKIDCDIKILHVYIPHIEQKKTSEKSNYTTF